MHTALWACALLAYAAIVAGAGVIGFASETPLTIRLVALLFGVLAAGVSVLLVLARFARLPPWGSFAMRLLCVAFPALWLLGSLDYGTLSGLEFLSVLVVASLSWAAWRVFRLFAAAAV